MANFRNFIHNEQPEDDGFERLFNEYQEFLNSEDNVPSEPISEAQVPQQPIQGSQGVKGDKGDTGERGLRGLRGITGPKGERGDRGEKGDKGDKGEIGSKGESGEKGEIGNRGEKGDQGETGSQGSSGSQGLRGEKGETGDRGEQGENGDVGSQGEQGIQGIQGEQGERGQRGEQGLQGEVGEKGEQGLNGKTGEKGEKGDTGSQGGIGLQGKKGDKGDIGSQGISGLNGKKGDRGEQGLKGEKGATGESGILHAMYPLKYDANTKTLKVDLSKINKGTTVLGNPGGGLDTAFKYIQVSGQSGLTSIQYTDETLRFVAGANVTLTTDPTTNSITISSLGGSGGGGSGGNGSTGAQGTTGYGFTAASVSGDNYLYISTLYPDGSVGSPMQLGFVKGNTGATGPVGNYVSTFNGRTGDVSGITQAAGTTFGAIQYRDFAVGATGLSASSQFVWGSEGLSIYNKINITGAGNFIRFPDGSTQSTSPTPIIQNLLSQITQLEYSLSVGDLNQNGVVNGEDLGILLGNWGAVGTGSSFQGTRGMVVDDSLYPPTKSMNDVKSLIVYNRGDRNYNRISADDLLSDLVYTVNGMTGDINISGYKFTQGATAPTGASAGDRWININTGLYYTAFANGASTIWIQL